MTTIMVALSIPWDSPRFVVIEQRDSRKHIVHIETLQWMRDNPLMGVGGGAVLCNYKYAIARGYEEAPSLTYYAELPAGYQLCAKCRQVLEQLRPCFEE